MMMIVSLHLSLCLSPVCIGAAEPALADVQEDGDAAKLYRRCLQLSRCGGEGMGVQTVLDQFIEELKSQKKLTSLKMIVQRQWPGHREAARLYVAASSSPEAIRFIRCLSNRSDFYSAVWELGRHPKGEVMYYFRHLASSRNATHRALAYMTALKERWADLLDSAWNEINSTETISYSLCPEEGANYIALIAHEYISKFEKLRPIPPLPKLLPDPTKEELIDVP